MNKISFRLIAVFPAILLLFLIHHVMNDDFIIIGGSEISRSIIKIPRFDRDLILLVTAALMLACVFIRNSYLFFLLIFFSSLSINSTINIVVDTAKGEIQQNILIFPIKRVSVDFDPDASDKKIFLTENWCCFVLVGERKLKLFAGLTPLRLPFEQFSSLVHNSSLVK